MQGHVVRHGHKVPQCRHGTIEGQRVKHPAPRLEQSDAPVLRVPPLLPQHELHLAHPPSAIRVGGIRVRGVDVAHEHDGGACCACVGGRAGAVDDDVEHDDEVVFDDGGGVADVEAE